MRHSPWQLFQNIHNPANAPPIRNPFYQNIHDPANAPPIRRNYEVIKRELVSGPAIKTIPVDRSMLSRIGRRKA